MNKNISISFIVGLLAVSCYQPPIYLFTDPYLLPKWYLCLLGLVIVGVLIEVGQLRRWKFPPLKEVLSSLASMFVAVSVLECLWVMGCIIVFGLRPGGEIGTLGNPPELALNLCVAIPWAVQLVIRGKGWLWRVLYGLATLLLVSVLLLTQSRTGLICLAVFVVVLVGVGICRLAVKKWIRMVLCGVCVLIVAIGTVAYVTSHKTDSTSGRAFILGRTWELIGEHPIMGHGTGGFEREYMLRQATYFKEHPDSEAAMLADEIRHPLCEFAYLWVNWGVVAPVVLLVLLLFPWWRRLKGHDESMKPFLSPILAIGIFSCFSYPFYYPIAWTTVGLSVFFAIREVLGRMPQRIMTWGLLLTSVILAGFTVNDMVHEHLWYKAYRRSFREKEALEDYERLHGYFCRNHSFLYSYAMASFKRGDLDRADRMIAECGEYWNGYNRELLSADICRYRQEYERAIAHYKMAQLMCPVRFAPLEGLYNVYDSMGDTLHRDEVANQIATKRIKVHSAVIERIKSKYQ